MASCNPLTEGYAAHLTKISSPGGSVPAQGNARMVIPRFAATFSDTKKIGEEAGIYKEILFSEPVLGCPASFNISLYHSATAHNSPCGPTQKSHIIDVMMRMMLMTILVMVMTAHLALETFLFNLQIQLSAAISSAIFSHVHVMKFVKEENILLKVMKASNQKN